VHDLPELQKLSEALNPKFSVIITKCDILNQYGVVTRYPGYLPLDQTASAVALQYAQDINQFITETIADEEKQVQP
jgi:hypothetical protein